MEKNTGLDELMTVDDIMDYLDASRSTVHRLIKRGAIQAIPVNAPQDQKWSPLRVRKQDFVKAILGDN